MLLCLKHFRDCPSQRWSICATKLRVRLPHRRQQSAAQSLSVKLSNSNCFNHYVSHHKALEEVPEDTLEVICVLVDCCLAPSCSREPTLEPHCLTPRLQRLLPGQTLKIKDPKAASSCHRHLRLSFRDQVELQSDCLAR